MNSKNEDEDYFKGLWKTKSDEEEHGTDRPHRQTDRAWWCARPAANQSLHGLNRDSRLHIPVSTTPLSLKKERVARPRARPITALSG